MKKLFLLFCVLTAGVTSNAQTILVPGGDMETWRTSPAGSGTSSLMVEAPVNWYGADSLFIALGQSALSHLALMVPDSVWHRQLFEENTIIHSGAHSAKLITAYQDTLLIPGILSNAITHVGIAPTPPYISGITYSGGTAVPSLRPTYVSAWTEYFPGTGGLDTGVLTVQALSYIGDIDSVVGTGVVLIPPNTSWTQIVDSIIYANDSAIIDTIRITFTSSGGAAVSLDSSTLYVDDVTITGTPVVSHAGVKNVAMNNDVVKVYPNPATAALYFDGPQNGGLSCTLYSINGKAVVTTALTGNNALDISYLPEGLYFYAIYDSNGGTVQRGKVSVIR